MADEQDGPAEMADDQDQQQQPPADRRPAARRDDEPADLDAIRAERDRLRQAVSKANKEAAASRHRLAELERAEQERADKDLSESERLKKEAREAREARAEAERKAEDAQSALQRTILDAAVEREAGKMNFIYPDIAPSLIDRRRVSIDEETGKPAGIKEALERLLKDKPDLAYASPRGGTPPREGPSRRPGNGGDRRRPTPDEELEAGLRATRNYTS